MPKRSQETTKPSDRLASLRTNTSEYQVGVTYSTFCVHSIKEIKMQGVTRLMNGDSLRSSVQIILLILPFISAFGVRLSHHQASQYFLYTVSVEGTNTMSKYSRTAEKEKSSCFIVERGPTGSAA